MIVEKLKKYREYLFLLAIFFLPIYQTINHWLFGGFLTLSFLLIFLEKNSNPISKSTRIALIAVALFFFVQVMGLLHPLDLNYGLKKVLRAIPFLIYPVAILSFRGTRNFRILEKKIFYGLVLGCLTTAIICWTNIILTLNKADLPENTFFGWKKSGIYLTEILDLHPPYLGLLLVAAILFLLKENFYDSKSKGPSLYLNSIAAIILFVFLFNITARNSLIFLICLIFVFTFYKRLWKLLIIQLVFAAILTFVVINHPSQYYRLKLYYMLGLSDNSVKDKRFERLKASYTVFRSSPIFGVGPGHDVNKKIEQYSLLKDDIAVKDKLNSHNQLFEYLAISGIIGGMVYVGVNIYLLILLYRTKEYFYLILLTGFLLASLTESTFERILGIQFYCIIIALALLSKESSPLPLKTRIDTYSLK